MLRATARRCYGALRHYSRDALHESAGVLELGKKLTMSRCFSRSDLVQQCALSGDSNPIHTDASSAKAAGFSGCVVQGMLTAGLFPAIIGSNFAGAIYVSQTLRFHQAALADEDLIAEVVVKEMVKLKRHFKVTFDTSCFKEASKSLVVDGTAVALVPRTSNSRAEL